MVTSDLTPTTWAHVVAKGAQNRHGNDDNRIEVSPQGEQHNQASGCSPYIDDLKTTDTTLDIGGEQQGPSHQRKHKLMPQDEDPLPFCRRYNLYCLPRTDNRGRGND